MSYLLVSLFRTSEQPLRHRTISDKDLGYASRLPRQDSISNVAWMQIVAFQCLNLRLVKLMRSDSISCVASNSIMPPYNMAQNFVLVNVPTLVMDSDF